VVGDACRKLLWNSESLFIFRIPAEGRGGDQMRRQLMAVVVLAVAVSTLPASAGTSPSCMLIRDPAGDATDQPSLSVPGVNQPDLDIVSADVASDERVTTTVIRVQRLGTALEAAGRRNQYRFSFYLGGYGDVDTVAYRSVDGEQFAVTLPAEGADMTRAVLPATGTFDVARNEVRVTIPLMQASGHRNVRKQTYFTRLAADTFRGFGAAGNSLGLAGGLGLATGVDHASSGNRYLAGSPSCVQTSR
jgi:hypothetical protein